MCDMGWLRFVVLMVANTLDNGGRVGENGVLGSGRGRRACASLLRSKKLVKLNALTGVNGVPVFDKGLSGN